MEGLEKSNGVLILQRCSYMLSIWLTPRKASSKLLLPSDCPPMATISGMGSCSPKATAAAWSREYASYRTLEDGLSYMSPWPWLCRDMVLLWKVVSGAVVGTCCTVAARRHRNGRPPLKPMRGYAGMITCCCSMATLRCELFEHESCRSLSRLTVNERHAACASRGITAGQRLACNHRRCCELAGAARWSRRVKRRSIAHELRM